MIWLNSIIDESEKNSNGTCVMEGIVPHLSFFQIGLKVYHILDFRYLFSQRADFIGE